MTKKSNPPQRPLNLPRQDTLDFAAAFAVGAVLGVGATVLLGSEPSRTDTLMRRLRSAGTRVRDVASDAVDAVEDAGESAGELSEDVVSAGRELIEEFRSEVTRILQDARAELREAAEEVAQDTSRQARKGRRRFGL